MKPSLIQALADMREYDALAGEAIEAALGIDPGEVADAIEAEIVRREVALSQQRIQRTHVLPGKTRPTQVERDYETRRVFAEAAKQGERPQAMGRLPTPEARAAMGREAGRLEQQRRAERAAEKRASAAAWRAKHR